MIEENLKNVLGLDPDQDLTQIVKGKVIKILIKKEKKLMKSQKLKMCSIFKLNKN